MLFRSYTQKAEDANVVTNLWDGLLSFDCYGKVVPAIASSWEHNEDATVWTFHLRDDVDWVDCNGCLLYTSQRHRPRKSPADRCGGPLPRPPHPPARPGLC